MFKRIIFALSLLYLLIGYAYVACASTTQQRIDNDISASKPIVIQVVVALADNKNQWIVPVPATLGNGQETRSNLYWGAMYGLKSYMLKKAGWKLLGSQKPSDGRILERLILAKTFYRKKKSVTVYMLADAWDGRFILESIEQYFRYNAGHDVIDISINRIQLKVGGEAHLVAYIGHNALMDYLGSKNLLLSTPAPAIGNPNNDAIVLACKSQAYFTSRLTKLKAHPLLLTTGLMAPEAYTLDAAITSWIEGGSDSEVRKASAKIYNRFQKTGSKAAERLFGAH